MTTASSGRDRIRRSLPRPDHHVIVLFGATGDLARRKLLPGLYHLFAAGLLPEGYRIVGSGRRALTSEQFRERARQSVAEFGTTKPTGEAWRAFARALSFGSAQPGDTAPLVAAIGRAEEELGGPPRRLFHLAIPPASFEPTVTMLAGTGLAHSSRIIVEKPFGTDLASARVLNHTLHAVFDESQIFRIDHFLGKKPGAQMSLGAAQMTFRYQDSFCLSNGLKGYERLILDAMLGDQALFTRADGVERLWEISAPLLNNPPPVQPYPPASWGPEPALRRLAAPFRWHLSSTGPPA